MEQFLQEKQQQEQEQQEKQQQKQEQQEKQQQEQEQQEKQQQEQEQQEKQQQEQQEKQQQEQLLQILKELHEQGCPEVLKEIEEILKLFIKEGIELPFLLLSFKFKGYIRGDDVNSSNLTIFKFKDIDFVVKSDSDINKIKKLLDNLKLPRNEKNTSNTTFIVNGIDVEFMYKTPEEIQGLINLRQLFLIKLLMRMENEMYDGIRLSGTRLSFEINGLKINLNDNLSSLVKKLEFDNYPSVHEMAHAVLNSPILKYKNESGELISEITNELLYKLIISLFRHGSHRHFFAFLQQLMLQKESKYQQLMLQEEPKCQELMLQEEPKYQLRTDDGETWSLLEKNKSGVFEVKHTIHNMDTKKVEPPLTPIKKVEEPDTYSLEALKLLHSQKNFLQNLIEGKVVLPCTSLGFVVDHKEYIKLMTQVEKNLSNFSHEKLISHCFDISIKIDMFIKDSVSKKFVQPSRDMLIDKTANDELRESTQKSAATKLDENGEKHGTAHQHERFKTVQVSSEDKKRIREDLKEQSRATPSQEETGFASFHRNLKDMSETLSKKKILKVYEKISEGSFSERLNQSIASETSQEFEALIADIKRECSNVALEMKEEDLAFLHHIKEQLTRHPQFANKNKQDQLLIDIAIEKASRQGQ